MTILFIKLRNADFCSRDAGVDYATPEAALVQGTQSAVAMAAEEIVRGSLCAAVMVTVEQPDGKQLLSTAVTITTARILANEAVSSL